MEKAKEIFNTIINKSKLWVKSFKDSKLLELIFFSFVFVMLILSLMGICVAMSSNKYKSAVVTNELTPSEEVKEISPDSFLIREDKEESSTIPSTLPGEENPSSGEVTVPDEILTISCTSSIKRDLDDIYPTSIVEQIIAKFDAKTKVFYQADVSIAMYYLKQNTDDLEALQALYEQKLGKYAGYFNISDYNVTFSAPTEAYINLKEMNYDTYYMGYGKETETYDSFLYTFETGHYYCQT